LSSVSRQQKYHIKMKQYILVLFGSLVFNGARFLYDLVILNSMDIEDYKIYGLLSLLAVYLNHLHFGLANGVAIVSAQCKGRSSNICRLLSVTRSLVGFITVGLVTLAMIPVSFFIDSDILLGLWMLAATMFIFNFSVGLAKMDMAFQNAAIIQILSGVVFICGAIAFYSKGSLYPVIFLTASAFTLPLLLVSHKFLSGKIQFYLRNIRATKIFLLRSLRLGWPVMALGFCYTILTTVDRLLINFYYSAADFRMYSLACLVLAFGHLVISVVSSINYPKLTSLYLSKNKKGAAAFYFLQFKNSLRIGCMLALFVGIATVIFGRHFMDATAINVIYVGCLGLPGISGINAVTLAYNTAGKQLILVKRSSVAIVLYLLSLSALSFNAVGLILYAAFSAFFYVAFALLIYRFSKVDLAKSLNFFGANRID